MYCSNCGAQNADIARFCEKCGTGLVATPPPPPQPETRMRGVDSVPAPTAPGPAPGAHPVTGKNPVLALVLSLVIVGVGQFYNGDPKKGALMLIGAILGFFISGGLISFALWVWSMIDAYQVASGKGKVW